MISCIADNITSPLGESTAQNYEAVKAGRCALRQAQGPFRQAQGQGGKGHTRFETLAVKSAESAILESGINPSQENVVLILSTTKANIEVLEKGEDPSPALAAQHIAQALGIVTQPIVVCNACISGVAAIILAQRLLEGGIYDYAIVCGADVLTKFTVSGFESLKAVSDEPCRPFDIERLGLNLGEAAATMVLTHGDSPRVLRELSTQGTVPMSHWTIEAGAIRNDGFHISSPSKDGEGARRALEAILRQAQEPIRQAQEPIRQAQGPLRQAQGPSAEAVKDSLAQINAHGTATMFNDQMESVAIERAGLNEVPVNALKGYFGHTLGAAGILETIITMRALDDHTIIGTKGFEERGVSGKILVTKDHQPTDKQRFVKMISGFGGGNAAILVGRGDADGYKSFDRLRNPFDKLRDRDRLRNFPTIHITPKGAWVDGKAIETVEEGSALLTELYKHYIGDYPKYYKMDALSRLGFVASELLLKHCQAMKPDAIILFNHSSSIQADRNYQTSIADPENYFPSPSAFVYTLPNIVTGEIAIRNHIQGETSFFILQEKDEQLMQQIIAVSFADTGTQRILCGWVDAEDEEHFEAELTIRD